MRLTCPNCGAQYEVDETVIPKGGRDVQCSACGHTWYQYPMEVALSMRAAELDEDEDEDEALQLDGAPRPAPRIDKTVLDVLREEAERELDERKRARAEIETQGELGLTRPMRSKAAPSHVYGEDDPEPAPLPEGYVDPEDQAEEAPVRRRNLLPDIEELTSTLEPGGGLDDEEGDGEEGGEKQGFRRGFSLVVLVAAALVALYLLAPLLASWLPFLRGALAAYVSLVDGLRGAVAGMLRGLLGG